MAERQTLAGCDKVCAPARHFAGVPDHASSLRLLDEIAAPAATLAPFSTTAPIALYGAGNLGRMAKEFLDAVGQSFDLVIDRNPARPRDDPFWRGHRVVGPEDVPDEVRRSHVILVTVATAPYAPLEAFLRDAGFEHVVPFYDFAENFRSVHPLSNGWFAHSLSQLDLRMIQRALGGFADDTSRAHHLQFLAWRRLRQEWTFDGAAVTGADRFFIPEVMAAMRGDEIFVDAGAHHGSVVESFARRMNGRFKRILAVEPDAANREKLRALITSAFPGDERIRVLECALGSMTGHAPFHAGLGYASQISSTGDTTVELAKLDDLGAASFVKLHLEGAELDALQGGRDMLVQHRPIVAATVYHNDDGIWRTPLWLMDTLEDYRFLFRLHSWCGTGAVVYAIPEERCR